MPTPPDQPSIERCLREHHELRDRVESLSEFLTHARPGAGSEEASAWAGSLARHLLELHGRLVRHFGNEEDDSTTESLLQEHPEAARRLREMHKDHLVILAWVRELMTATMVYSEGRFPDDPRLRSRVQELLQKIGAHEKMETSVLQSLVTEDLGGRG